MIDICAIYIIHLFVVTTSDAKRVKQTSSFVFVKKRTWHMPGGYILSVKHKGEAGKKRVKHK